MAKVTVVYEVEDGVTLMSFLRMYKLEMEGHTYLGGMPVKILSIDVVQEEEQDGRQSSADSAE